MKTYLVGGAVRDKIMGIPSHDNDYVVVGSSIEEMLSRGFIPVGKSFPVFVKKNDKSEYALARKEIKNGLKHTDFSFIFDESITLKEDLARRDFTCNAIAYNEEEDKYIDYYHGAEDIANKTLRHINSHFCEDPLRVIRLCRLVAQLNFSVAPETLELCKKMVTNRQLEYLSAERIWNEIKRALQYPHFYRFIETAHECLALKNIMPAVEKLWFIKTQNKEKMLIEYTIDCLKSVANNSEIVKFATLLHNIGKTGTLEEPNLSDIECEQLGVSIIKQTCQSLKIPSDYQKFAILTCRNHKNFLQIESIDLGGLLDIIDEYLRKLPTHFEDFIAILKTGSQDSKNKSEEKIRKIYSILSNISAHDMPDFNQLAKDSLFKDKYRTFRLEILKTRL